jgi:hypothetical protein
MFGVGELLVIAGTLCIGAICLLLIVAIIVGVFLLSRR